MENYIIIAILLIVLGLAIGYIVKAKRSGQKCIGCPYSNSCQKNNCSSNCQSRTNK